MSAIAADLKGEVALVTGTTSGLGHRFAKILAANGARVALTGRRTDRLKDLQAEIEKAGGTCAAIALDVTDEESIVACVAATEKALGPTTILVNNAGIGLDGLVLDAPTADFDRMMATNVRGPYIAAREVARRMIEKKIAGRIVNIASLAAVKVLPGLVGYCASKAALAMMTKAMAREWARYGINVNAICPGYIETEINAEFFHTEIGQKQVSRYPRRRVGSPEDLDGALLLLASPASRFITGDRQSCVRAKR